MADFTGIFGAPFDASAVDPTGPVGQLPVSGPDGIPVAISASEIKPAKQEGNFFLELELTVIEGEHIGSSGVVRLNLVNANETAVRIAQRELSAICRVVGVWNPADSAELHGIPFRVITVEKKYTGNDGKEYSGSEVKKFLDINGNPPMSDGNAKAAPAQTAKPQVANPTPPPATTWKKNEAPVAAPSAAPAWAKKK